MQSESVQIGSLVISKTIFEALIVLCSVIIGGMISYFTTQGIERQKIVEQKKEKLQECRREALALALEWIPPIEIALSQASSLSSRFINNYINSNEFIEQWPNLLSQLAKKDIPMRLNVLLPPAIQKQIDIILEQLNELQSYTLFAGKRGINEITEWKESVRLFLDQNEKLNNNFESLKRELKAEYHKTFI